MTLLERCRTLRGAVDRRNEMKRAHKDSEVFRERLAELQTTKTALSETLARLAILREKGVAVVPLPSAAVALKATAEYRERLVGDATESGRDSGRFKRSIDKIVRDVKECDTKSTASVIRDVPSIEEVFLKQVELIPTYTTQVQKIRQVRDGLLQGIDPQSMSAESLARFLDRRAELRALADQLNPGEFPKEVLDFFRAARSGGASLDKFTVAVQAWLAARDQLKNVRVSVVAK